MSSNFTADYTFIFKHFLITMSDNTPSPPFLCITHLVNQFNLWASLESLMHRPDYSKYSILHLFAHQIPYLSCLFSVPTATNQGNTIEWRVYCRLDRQVADRSQLLWLLLLQRGRSSGACAGLNTASWIVGRYNPRFRKLMIKKKIIDLLIHSGSRFFFER